MPNLVPKWGLLILPLMLLVAMPALGKNKTGRCTGECKACVWGLEAYVNLSNRLSGVTWQEINKVIGEKSRVIAEIHKKMYEGEWGRDDGTVDQWLRKEIKVPDSDDPDLEQAILLWIISVQQQAKDQPEKSEFYMNKYDGYVVQGCVETKKCTTASATLCVDEIFKSKP